jgi:SPP1 family predicted phage head-tail adaptor
VDGVVAGLNAGTLDRQFRLDQPSGLDGSSYETVDDSVWGAKRFASGSEVLRASTPTSQVTHVVTLRYREDLRAAWCLVEEDTSPETVSQIVSFGDPDGRREQLKVFVVELQ